MTPDARGENGAPSRASDDAGGKTSDVERKPGFVIGYREKPVSLTAALAAAGFLIIGALTPSDGHHQKSNPSPTAGGCCLVLARAFTSAAQ